MAKGKKRNNEKRNVEVSVRPSTHERYEAICRPHLSPTLGKVKLNKLTSAHVRGLLRSKADEGVSPSMRRYVRTTLNKATKEALS